MQKSYTFTVYLTGIGNTPEEAWEEVQKTVVDQLQETPQTYVEEETE